MIGPNMSYNGNAVVVKVGLLMKLLFYLGVFALWPIEIFSRWTRL